MMMTSYSHIQIDEISNIICERIEQYNKEVKVVNTSTVLQVGDDSHL